MNAWIESTFANVIKMGGIPLMVWKIAIESTIYMTFWSFVFGGLLGLLAGLLLY